MFNRFNLRRESQMKPENCPDVQNIKKYYDDNKVFTIKSYDVFVSTVNTLFDVASISDRIIPIKAYLDLVRKTQLEASVSVCLDDEFLAACDFLKLEISLFSAVYFMRGISIDFKETKFNRNPVDLLDIMILADLRHKLSKPNQILGAVESNTIQTCYARLVRRINLHKRSEQIIKRIQAGVSKQEVMREFSLTLTDFELVYRIAQRGNLIQPNFKRREFEMRYILTSSNHDALQEYAYSNSLAPQEVVNEIVEKFFMTINKKKVKKEDKENA